MNITALLLADSRFPGGGHAHSGGVEEAAARGLLSTEDSLSGLLLGRLRTAGELAAVFAAAAAHGARTGAGPEFWSTLDAELDARTPSAAQREVSRALGSAVRRAMTASFSASSALNEAFIAPLHHPIALGALIGIPADAALSAAYLSVSGPAR
jgi:urease accessory protein